MRLRPGTRQETQAAVAKLGPELLQFSEHFSSSLSSANPLQPLCSLQPSGACTSGLCTCNSKQRLANGTSLPEFSSSLCSSVALVPFVRREKQEPKLHCSIQQPLLRRRWKKVSKINVSRDNRECWVHPFPFLLELNSAHIFFLQYTQTECNLVGIVGAGVLSFKKGSHHTGQAGLNLSSVGITGIHKAVCIAFFRPHKKGTVIYTSVT